MFLDFALLSVYPHSLLVLSPPQSSSSSCLLFPCCTRLASGSVSTQEQYSTVLLFYPLGFSLSPQTPLCNPADLLRNPIHLWLRPVVVANAITTGVSECVKCRFDPVSSLRIH